MSLTPTIVQPCGCSADIRKGIVIAFTPGCDAMKRIAAQHPRIMPPNKVAKHFHGSSTASTDSEIQKGTAQ
jgi:hypothetical protein